MKLITNLRCHNVRWCMYVCMCVWASQEELWKCGGLRLPQSLVASWCVLIPQKIEWKIGCFVREKWIKSSNGFVLWQNGRLSGYVKIGMPSLSCWHCLVGILRWTSIDPIGRELNPVILNCWCKLHSSVGFWLVSLELTDNSTLSNRILPVINTMTVMMAWFNITLRRQSLWTSETLWNSDLSTHVWRI